MTIGLSKALYELKPYQLLKSLHLEGDVFTVIE